MRDVAGTAGVSLKTVSRVVNGEAGVRADTAARVEAAIARLGFARNDVARSLRHGRAGALGLVIEDVANPFYSAIARAVEDAAHARGHILITAPARRTPSASASSSCACCARSVDALLIVPAGADHRYLLPELAAGTPIVFLDRPPRRRRGGHRPARQPRRRARRRSSTCSRAATTRIAFVGDAPRPVYRARAPAPAIARRSSTPGSPWTTSSSAPGSHDAARAERAVRALLELPARAGPPRCSRATTATPSARCGRCATRRGRSRSSASTTSSWPTCSPRR